MTRIPMSSWQQLWERYMRSRYKMPAQIDDNGNVIYLAARAPGQVAAQVTSGAIAYRGARSGNASFDPSSGRFAAKGTRTLQGSALVNQNPVPVTRSGIPQGITPDEWERRLDLVRKAARELASVDPSAAQGFLKGRVTDLSKVDIQQFMTDVRAHQIDDLLDAFDAHMRQAKAGIKVVASAGWVKKMFRSMTDAELSAFATRLQGRGFSAKQIGKSVAGRVKDPAIKESLANQLKVKLEDEDDVSIDFEDWEPEPEPPEIHVLPTDQAIALIDAVRELSVREQPAPVVNVAPAEVRVELPRSRPKRIVRDPSTNEIIGVDPY